MQVTVRSDRNAVPAAPLELTVRKALPAAPSTFLNPRVGFRNAVGSLAVTASRDSVGPPGGLPGQAGLSLLELTRGGVTFPSCLCLEHSVGHPMALWGAVAWLGPQQLLPQ